MISLAYLVTLHSNKELPKLHGEVKGAGGLLIGELFLNIVYSH